MKTNLFFWVFIIVLFTSNAFSQQLIINEVSQGPTGAQEYVELLVTGTPTCNGIPCLDLRNYIIDDNNGNHATGAGTGIAAGCMRFKNVAFWSCIPIGTIILIYNDADQNPLIPAQDLSMTDGNCRLVIPISDCTLLERHTTLPSSSSITYPGSAFVNCGSWTQLAMANSDDSFQTIDPSGTLLHSVSWGNNTLSPIIYFAGAASGKVALMNNIVDNNPANQANWVFVTVTGNESPGVANNTANNNWIISMNNSCQPLLPFSTTVAFSNAGCTCNGSATLNAIGAIAPYTYTWVPSGGNSAIASNLCVGVYTVTATSANGCVQSKTVSITSVSSLSLSISNTSISCNGMANGSATASINGGTAPYSYTWSPSGGNASSASGLSNGIYTVYVHDANNCSATATTTILQPTTPLSSSISATNVLCFGSNSGTASINVSGGTPGYSYTWSPSGGNSAIAVNLFAGTYSVVLKDANNCLSSKSVTITQPATGLSAVVSSTNILCYGATSGAVTSIASGGSPAYTYSWMPGNSSGSSVNGLSSGSYTVTIHDSNNCSVTATTAISQPTSSLSAIISSTNVLCFGVNSGAASIAASGGTPAYSYTWSPTGGNSSFAGNLTSGSYSVIIKDANNCLATNSVTITQPASALGTVVSSTNILCYGFSNGAANVSVSGGTPIYTYSWSPSGGTNFSATGLTAGVYNVSIKDANNCLSTVSVNISQPVSALSVVISSSNVLCYGSSNGVASANVNGGTPAYTYSWTPSGGNNSSATGLTAGIYSLTIKDANSCTAIATTTVTQPLTTLTTTIASANVSCFGAANGSAFVSASGGTPNYSYTWSHPAVTTQSVNGLTAGNYTVVVKDANNCLATATVFITEPAQITLSVNSLFICNNQPGILTTTVSGGVAPLIFNWNGNPTSSGTLAVTSTATTVYTVNVMDANGCLSLPQTATTTIAGLLNLTAQTGYSVCSGDALTLNANAFGGTGNYQYTWQPGNMYGATQVISNVSSSQVYTLNVSDGCSSSVTKTITLFVYPIPASEITSSEHTGCAPLCVTFSNMPLNLSGLIETYNWSFGDNTSSPIDTPEHCYKKSGSYSVAINYMTINGCAGTQTLSNYVTVYPTPVAAFEMDKSEISIYNTSVNFNNQSTNANNFSWYFSNEGTSKETNPSFTFTKEENQLILLIAKNQFGCADTVMKEIKYTPDFTFFAPNAFSPNNDDINETFLPMGTGWNTDKFELSIYDRWGTKIFETTRYDEGWDGKLHGIKVQNDTYVWKVSLYDIRLKHHNFIGHVLVETN